MYFLDICIELLRYDGCYLVQHAHVVDTCNLYGNNKVQLLVCFPFGCKNPVAVATLQRVGYGAVALVYDDVLVLVVISQYVITGNRVAAVGDYISVFKALLCQVDWGLAVNVLVYLLCNFIFFLLVAAE